MKRVAAEQHLNVCHINYECHVFLAQGITAETSTVSPAKKLPSQLDGNYVEQSTCNYTHRYNKCGPECDLLPICCWGVQCACHVPLNIIKSLIPFLLCSYFVSLCCPPLPHLSISFVPKRETNTVHSAALTIANANK